MVLKVQPVGCQQLGRTSAVLWTVADVLCWPHGSAEQFGQLGLKASLSLGW